MKQPPLARTASDPFLHHAPLPFENICNVLGIPVRFESNRAWFLRLTEQAYGELPAVAGLEPDGVPCLCMRLLANDDAVATPFEQPPEPYYYGTEQMTMVSFTSSDIAISLLQAGRGYITISPAMARFPYHVRYEMIEFATYRMVQGRLCSVGLHAGGVARGDRSMLIFGPAGAGKSTLVFACLLEGWDLIGEDAIFVLPGQQTVLRGVPTYIHLLDNALHFFPGLSLQEHAVSHIVRRSGRAKLEIDMRLAFGRPSRVEAPLDRVIFLNPQRRKTSRLRPLRREHACRLLDVQQPFAQEYAPWPIARDLLLSRPLYELELGNHPLDAARLLTEMA